MAEYGSMGTDAEAHCPTSTVKNAPEKSHALRRALTTIGAVVVLVMSVALISSTSQKGREIPSLQTGRFRF
jgi:predicted secreted protein